MNINSRFRTIFIITLGIFLYPMCVHSVKESDFSFLVQRGYRQEPHQLAKHAVFVKMVFDDGMFGHCTGAILKPDIILTAAHCVFDEYGVWTKPENLYVIAGTPNVVHMSLTAQIIQARKYLAHPNYNMAKKDFDIALIYLKYNIEEDGVTAQRIGISHKRVPPGTKCTALGWGRLYFNGITPDEIVYADYVIWSDKKCRKFLRAYHYRTLCARNDSDIEISLEAGDSGGPLICNGLIVGVASYIIPVYGPFPNAYQDTYVMRAWIDENSSYNLSPINFLYIAVFAIVLLQIFVINCQLCVLKK